MKKCKRCPWGTWLTRNKVYCMFPVCFKEKMKKGEKLCPENQSACAATQAAQN